MSAVVGFAMALSAATLYYLDAQWSGGVLLFGARVDAGTVRKGHVGQFDFRVINLAPKGRNYELVASCTCVTTNPTRLHLNGFQSAIVHVNIDYTAAGSGSRVRYVGMRTPGGNLEAMPKFQARFVVAQ
jgi:hypothetical protein